MSAGRWMKREGKNIEKGRCIAPSGIYGRERGIRKEKMRPTCWHVFLDQWGRAWGCWGLPQQPALLAVSTLFILMAPSRTCRPYRLRNVPSPFGVSLTGNLRIPISLYTPSSSRYECNVKNKFFAFILLRHTIYFSLSEEEGEHYCTRKEFAFAFHPPFTLYLCFEIDGYFL